MKQINYQHAPYRVRDDLISAHEMAWRRLASAGTWLDGAERVAIMAECRNAAGCALCQQRKQALSPYALDGAHDGLGQLSEQMVEIVHRIVTDPGRLSQSWYQQQLAAGIDDGRYVETLGVIASTVAIDTFAHAIGMPLLALPEPLPGEPSRHRPSAAKTHKAWVPTIDPRDACGAESDLYKSSTAAHIRQAMSLVPDEVRGFFELTNAQYLAPHEMRDFDHEFRAINHAQIELVAGRVSALNQCVY